MRFQEAIVKVINNYTISMLTDIFKVRSILSDYVGNSFYDKKLIDCFCHISKTESINDVFKLRGLKEGRDYFKEKYTSFKSVMSAVEYVDVINSIASIICKEEYEEYLKYKEKHVQSKISQAVVIKKVINQNSVKKNEILNPTLSPILNVPRNLKKIKGFVIKLNNQNLKIIPKTSGNICVFKGDSKRSISLSKYPIINDTLHLDLSDIDQDITITLSDKYHKNLNICSTDGNITVVHKGYHSIYFHNASIETVKGSIYLEGYFGKLNVKSEYGKIELTNLRSEILNVTNTYGKINFTYNTNMYRQNINLYTKYNDIELDLKKDKELIRRAKFRMKRNRINLNLANSSYKLILTAKSEYLRVKIL